MEYPSLAVQQELAYMAERLVVAPSQLPGAGLGLFTTARIGSGEVILVYCGVVRASVQGLYMLTVWEGGPMVDGTPRAGHPLSIAGRANDPLWQQQLCNTRFLDGACWWLRATSRAVLSCSWIMAPTMIGTP